MVTVFAWLEIVVCMVTSASSGDLGVGEGAAAPDELLGLDHGGGGGGRVAVGADDVGVLLGDGGAADHDDDPLAQARLGQRVDVRLEHRHRGGEERGNPHDVGLVGLYRVNELLR